MTREPDRVAETIHMSPIDFCKMFTTSPSLRSTSVCVLWKKLALTLATFPSVATGAGVGAGVGAGLTRGSIRGVEGFLGTAGGVPIGDMGLLEESWPAEE